MCFTSEVRWMIVPCIVSMSIMSTTISTDKWFFVVLDQLETLVNFVVGLTLICFLFCLLFYSAILKNLPYYSPQWTDYSLGKIHYSHHVLHNENSHVHKTVLCYHGHS